MKTHKIIFIGLIITVISIGYVHQRIEILKSEYKLQKSRKYLAYLVDQNTNLMYNLSKLESPKHLLTSLNGEEIEFASRRTREMRAYRIARIGSEAHIPKEGLFSKFMDLFTLNAEAKSRN